VVRAAAAKKADDLIAPIAASPTDPCRTGSTASRWLAGLLATLLLTLAANPATAGAGSLQTGVTNLYESAPLAFERTRGAGAHFVRIPLHWRATAPLQQPSSWRPEDPADPNYDWNESDLAVANAVQAGLTPVLDVDGTPTWVQRCELPGVVYGRAVCDPDPAALGAFATAAARRYSGLVAGVPRVSYWQALNEPNLSLFFFPQFDTTGRALSPALYRHLINAFSAGVKSVDPSNLVLSAGLGPVSVPPWTIGPMRFARELLCMRGHKRPHAAPGNCEGGVHFDIFAIQPYTTGAPTHEGKINDVQLGDLDKLQALLRAADRAGRIKGAFKRTPLWITEFSWDSKPPDPQGLPMKIETRWTAEALYQAWRAGVSHFFWFSLRDTARHDGEPYKETLESGLYFRGPTLEQDQPKPILKAFRFPFVAYPGKKGLSFWGRTPNSQPGRVVIQIWKGRRWRKVAAVRAGKMGIFRGRAATSYGQGKRGSARAFYGGEDSAPFSMKPVADFHHRPFG
jgi:hypothetical protein